jgi:hypothetical protein
MGSQKSGQRETTKARIQTVAEIKREYPDEWILLEITRDRKHPHRVAGRLLAHSRNRADLNEPYQRFRAEHPDTRVYQFFTGGEKIPEDVVVIL